MIEYLPILMFVALFLFLFIGVPIAFSLCFVSIAFAWGLWGFNSTSLLTSAAWGTMNNFTLIAIPLFIFMAVILEKTNIVSELFESVYKLSGGLKGGLAIATILVGSIIGAVSGVVAAGVIGLAFIALPQMLKYKYDRKLSLGVVMAGGTLGQIIPPSLNMVIYGAITGVSVGSLFAAGLNVGIVLAGLFCVYILINAYLNKSKFPSLPKEQRVSTIEKIKSLKSLIFPLILIVLVLGTILTGAATPTEGAGVGALGALLLGIVTRRLSFTALKASFIETLKISSMVGWILVGASAFGSVFAGIGGNALVANIAQSLPGGKWGVLILCILFILFLGMFLETAALIMLAAPIVSPLLVQYGFDPLWWAIIFMTLLQMAFLTPPFGFAIFYLKGAVSDDISIQEIYRATFPFLVLQLICVILIILFPALFLWLPNLL
ncbi:TRAP transporter large permease subunit [Anaerobacillus sp. MEB173]|uniref:TRAP transporter large permease n=1 Tax=Anaerobacillus sp. MEB173 TaxID=3383345 RepID=UPI003F90F7CC